MLLVLCSGFLLTLAGVGILRVKNNPQAASKFERNYASISARIADSGVVATHACFMALKRGDRKVHLGRGLRALAVLGGCIMLPILALLISNYKLPFSPWALGSGALLWTCFLEVEGSRHRLKAAFETPLRCLSFPRIAITLAVANIVVIALAVVASNASIVDSLLMGASLVAMADLVSTSLALWWAARSNPLDAPSPDVKSDVRYEHDESPAR